MQIRTNAAIERMLDWANTPTGWTAPLGRRRHKILRVDVALVFFFLVCVGYYGWTSGWTGAVAGGVTYILLAFAALFFF